MKNVEDTKTNFSKKFTPENNDDRETLEHFFGSVDSAVEKYSDWASNCVLKGNSWGFEMENLKPSLVILFKNIINLFLTSGEDKEKLAELEICLEIISSQEDRDSFNWKERIHR